MTEVQAKARFRIMMLIAELQELADASPNARETARVEAILLQTIETLGQKPTSTDGPMMLISPPGRA